MKVFWLSAVLVTSAGCSLDPFLYTPATTDKYTFVGPSTDPLENVEQARIEPLTIPVNAEVTLGAVYIQGNVQPPKGHVLYFHGKGDHIGASQFPRMKRLANSGYDVLAFDYRGFGTSTRLAPTEAGVNEDTKAARDFLSARLGGAPIFYYGHSFGCAAAEQRAVTDPPQLLIIESAFASIQDFVSDSSHTDLPWTFFANDSWDNVARIQSIHVPVLIIHGLDDDFVRPEFSQKIYDHANDPKQLELVPGAKHDVAKSLGAAYPTLVNSFVEKYAP